MIMKPSALPKSTKNQFYTYYLLFALLILAAGCKDKNGTTEAEPANQYLVESTLIGEYTKEAIGKRFSAIPQAALLTKYGVKVYKLTYKTKNTDGSDITTSGAILVPSTDIPVPLLSYQHGTITNDKSAPSYYQTDSEAWSLLTVLSSVGYVISAPDYIGYGASKDLPHPYEHANSLASASLDMLRATKEFCKKQNAKLNTKLFLAGYSEGGFATMSLHKFIEEKNASEFTVTASAPGAGAYDKTTFSRHIIGSNDRLEFISSYLWVLSTYNRIYAINRPFSYYVNEPWASALQTNVNANVEKVPSKLFTTSFLTSIKDNSDTPLLAAFKDNDVYDWKPTAPIALFHGTADDYVPFFNSENAYNAMRAKGATQVELRPIEGGNHFTSVQNYVLGVFVYFSSFNQN